MAELKTKVNEASVEDFLSNILDEKKRQDAFEVLELMQTITKQSPKMWGTSIIGFGTYKYEYKSGREGEWFLVGFSPRKQDLTIYINGGFEQHDDLMQQLGKYKASKGACLYVNKLEDIKLPVLKKLIKASIKEVKERYGKN
jgi:nucleoid DNA-binding protein